MTLDPKAVTERFNRLKGARGTHDSHWQEIAELLSPMHEFGTRSTPGGKRRDKIFNTAPISFHEELSAGLQGMLTSSALRWFALRPLPNAPDSRAVKLWFEQATEAMYAVFQSPRNRFNAALQEAYPQITAFGNGVLHIADRGRRGPLFQAVPLAQCYFEQNADGMVDTLYRGRPMRLSAALRLWPTTLPAKLREAAARNPDSLVEIIHGVEPSPPGAGSAARGASTWDGAYVCQGELLETERYREFPYAVARWAVEPGDDYGYGPGASALADVKMVNQMEKTGLRGWAKAVDPARFMPHDGFLSNPNFNPNSNNYYDSAAWRGLSNPIFYDQGSRPDLGEKKVELVEERLSRLFYIHVMRLPDQPNMTATEVLTRNNTMLRVMGPFTARLESELLNPIIERTFGIMMRNFLFPPPPPELRGQGWTVEYLGPLSKAMRAADAETVMRTLAAGQPLLQADPQVLDHIDAGKTYLFLADRIGMPLSLIRSDEDVATLRQNRAENERVQAEAAALRQGAGAAKDGATALATIAGIQGGAQ